MEVEFGDDELRSLATVAGYTGSWSLPIVKAYRKRVQSILAAVDERDLRFPGGNHFEKLRGERGHQHSLRLNDQWRLIIEIRRKDAKTIVRLVEIADYH
jgi:toxin HigB-1